MRKLTEDKGTSKHWPQLLPWLLLGYSCSVQGATGISPYQKLNATNPIIPLATQERISPPLNFDDPELAAAILFQRAKLVRRNVPMAISNILIAQHKDTPRYATVKGGAYIPR